MSESNNAYAVIGLGNPGSEYEHNRHNSGFMCLDYISRQTECDEFKKKKNFTFTQLRHAFGDKNVYLIKPQTYMNLSGNAVTACMSYFKIPKENIVVVYDDISLPFGMIRIRQRGSAGGHNGIKNIIQLLGGEDFPRIKIGVSSPKSSPDGNDVLKDYVLGDFSPEQLSTLENDIFPKIAKALPLIFDKNYEEAMSRFNKTIKG